MAAEQHSTRITPAQKVEMEAVHAAIGRMPERFRTLRLHLGLTQQEIAQLIGLSVRSYRALEKRPRSRRYADLLIRLSKTTNVSIDWIVCGVAPVYRFSPALENNRLPIMTDGRPMPPRFRLVQPAH